MELQLAALLQRFQTTYEELKLKSPAERASDASGFQTTYEELKLV